MFNNFTTTKNRKGLEITVAVDGHKPWCQRCKKVSGADKVYIKVEGMWLPHDVVLPFFQWHGRRPFKGSPLEGICVCQQWLCQSCFEKVHSTIDDAMETK